MRDSSAFIVGAGYMYGWVSAVLVGCIARGVFELGQRRPPVRVVYNCSTYALSAAAAGAAAHAVSHASGVQWLIADVFFGAAAFYSANVMLIAFVIAATAYQQLGAVLRDAVRSTALAFAIMFSVSLMLAVLWQRSPVLSAALLGPLLAIALYQRSTNREVRAMELALTDPLTGLGN